MFRSLPSTSLLAFRFLVNQIQRLSMSLCWRLCVKQQEQTTLQCKHEQKALTSPAPIYSPHTVGTFVQRAIDKAANLSLRPDISVGSLHCHVDILLPLLDSCLKPSWILKVLLPHFLVHVALISIYSDAPAKLLCRQL